MKLLNFYLQEEWRLGVKTERGVLDVTASAKRHGLETADLPQSVGQFLRGGDEAFAALSAHVRRMEQEGEAELFLDESALKLGPCVPEPGKIICVGLNYKKHAEESNMPVPEYPVLFNKFANSLAAHGEEIELPPESAQVDYEAELGIVIGKPAKRVSREQALSHVAGYCNVNDISARDLQTRTSQWLLGKCCDGFSPLGPWLVTADEVGNPNELEIKSIVNGQVRQHSNTADMIFPCDEIVHYISQYMTLMPGDVILTGTPEGVILGYPKDKQVWLKDGDVVEIEIEGLGRLANVMREKRGNAG
ncbi:fumarylacetoacetate hydrolase family protein [Brevibacillus massiliensis]|uniref:fumarylacetoacetate hydrolase family protein n=1 Tax=Brevibacillus massiliensis TaxID=1118054 RepID=UPI000363ABE6|nr:fumarylacetoacetate hydrolase family protein [Brevibacillus massiliensis]